jgi:hypothetical protein
LTTGHHCYASRIAGEKSCMLQPVLVLLIDSARIGEHTAWLCQTETKSFWVWEEDLARTWSQAKWHTL